MILLVLSLNRADHGQVLCRNAPIAQCCCCCCCFLTLTDPLRIQPWSQDRRNQTKSNRESELSNAGPNPWPLGSITALRFQRIGSCFHRSIESRLTTTTSNAGGATASSVLERPCLIRLPLRHCRYIVPYCVWNSRSATKSVSKEGAAVGWRCEAGLDYMLMLQLGRSRKKTWT